MQQEQEAVRATAGGLEAVMDILHNWTSRYERHMLSAASFSVQTQCAAMSQIQSFLVNSGAAAQDATVIGPNGMLNKTRLFWVTYLDIFGN